MKFSIVTISYNQAEFLERAILSVVDQDYGEIEYIVVDPGSTDGSREIIERYRDRIAKIIYDPDQGPADGLNKGFDFATGEVYGFLNSDDTLLPGAIRKVAEFFMLHTDIGLVSGHTYITDKDDNVLRKSYSEKFSLRRYAYGASVLMQASTFFRAGEFKKAGGFNVANRTNWDGELFLDMWLNGTRFYVLDEFLSCYRLQVESITASMKLDENIKKYREYVFKKIMGRDRRSYDKFIMKFYLLVKHLSSPRALWERICKGPIYGRLK